MHDSPAISVIVPAYNTEAFLPRCLDSLLAQAFPDFEAILVDDGSTDRTLSVLQAYAGRFAACAVVTQENQGLSAARNAGIQASRGRYIAFVDSDDWVAPTFLETLYRTVTEAERDIAQVAYATCSQPIDPQQPVEEVRVLSPVEALAEMLETEEYTVCTRLYARWLFGEAGDEGVFPVGLTCEDRVANFKLISKAHRIAVSNRIEYFYCLNLGSISYNGLDRRGFDLLAADALMVDGAKALGDATVQRLTEDRAAKGAYSLLVKWARFGVTDPALDEQAALSQLKADFKRDYPRLMASRLSFPKKAVAWQLRHTPWLVRAEFRLYNLLTGAGKPRKEASR